MASCPSSTALAGTNGNVMVGTTRVARITNWTVSYTAQTTVWGDSDSAGYTNRKGTRKDATGTIEGKIDTDHIVYELFDPGDGVILVLWENGTRYWYFPCAVIEEFSMNVNSDTQEVVGWSANWGADGIFYRPGAASQPSVSLPSSPGP